jgi:hypothetical protein
MGHNFGQAKVSLLLDFGYSGHFPPMVLGVFFAFFLIKNSRKVQKNRYFEINEEKWRVFERF